MPSAIRIVAGIIAICLAQGCATANEYIVADFAAGEGVATMPAVSLSREGRDAELHQECLKLQSTEVWRACATDYVDLNDFAWAFHTTGVFEGVLVEREGLDYSIALATAVYHRTNLPDLASAAAAGASLLILPVKFTLEARVEATVLRHGEVLRRFSYVLPFTSKFAVSNMYSRGDRDLAFSIASHVVKDLQSHGVFAEQQSSPSP